MTMIGMIAGDANRTRRLSMVGVSSPVSSRASIRRCCNAARMVSTTPADRKRFVVDRQRGRHLERSARFHAALAFHLDVVVADRLCDRIADLVAELQSCGPAAADLFGDSQGMVDGSVLIFG